MDGIKVAVQIRAQHFASIKSQIIRAASSIPMNIVEGSGQDSRKEFVRFLHSSLNSAYELEYQWLLIKNIELLDEETFGKTDIADERGSADVAGVDPPAEATRRSTTRVTGRPFHLVSCTCYLGSCPFSCALLAASLQYRSSMAVEPARPQQHNCGCNQSRNPDCADGWRRQRVE